MRKKIGYIAGTLLCAGYSLQGAPNCITDSWDLKKAIDFKTYHLVSEGTQACQHNCYTDPSSKLIGSNRNYCTGCGHYHLPRPYIIVSRKDTKNAKTPPPPTKKKDSPKLLRLPLVPAMLY